MRIYLFAFAAVFVLSSAASSTAQTLSDTERRIVEWVDAHNEESISFLEKVVDINSGTMNHEGVRRVGHLYAKAFAEIGMDTTWQDLSAVNRAGNLFAEQKGSRGKRLLLIGHLDTVFPKDSPFQKFEMLNDSIAAGPGTDDMKGGDNVILFALKALHAVGALDDARIVVAGVDGPARREAAAAEVIHQAR